MTTLIKSLGIDEVRELLQAAGFRAETGRAAPPKGDARKPIVHSASNGVNFEVRLLHPQPPRSDSYMDMMFMAGLRVKGTIAPDIVNRWNTLKRFGRLYTAPGWLVLAMDLPLLGGVPREYVQAQINIWDRLVQELLIWVRTVPSEATRTPPAPAKPGETKPGKEPVEAGLPPAAPGTALPEAAGDEDPVGPVVASNRHAASMNMPPAVGEGIDDRMASAALQ